MKMKIMNDYYIKDYSNINFDKNILDLEENK